MVLKTFEDFFYLTSSKKRRRIMKRITIWTIFLLLVVLAGPAVVMSGPPEPYVMPVEVTNTPSSQPAEISALPILPANYTRTVSPITIFTVPSNKLLVIEHFSMWDWEEGLVPDDTGVVMVIYTKLSTSDPVLIPHPMGIAKVLLNPDEGANAYGPRSIYSLAQPVRIYAGPETDVRVNIFRNHPIDSAQVFSVTLSGHYVDIDN